MSRFKEKGEAMLKRKMYDYLLQWKCNHGTECLMIRGARQVGKSYLVTTFGEHEYTSFVALDFVEHPEYASIFDGSLSAADIYSRITLSVPNVRLIPGKTLIFLDEIQECPNARTALKYLAIDGTYDVIASGSLLGIRFRELADAPSLPVGYERPITLHPLDFEEYLWARGYDERAVSELRDYFTQLEAVPRDINERFMALVREYLAIGGMPAVVTSFMAARDFGAAHRTQLMLHELYLDDIARYAPSTERAKARACYLSLPRQLAKENTKFQFAVVEQRGTARKFQSSISWLTGSEMVLVSRAVSAPSFPLSAYEEDRFRLYANDTGMLMAMYPFEMKRAVVENELKGPMKGGLYENLIATMLASQGIGLRYWRSSNNKYEIEFLVDGQGASVIPLEVKAGRGATASLNDMLQRDDVSIGYKLLDGNVGRDGKKITLPHYMAAFLAQELARHA